MSRSDTFWEFICNSLRIWVTMVVILLILSVMIAFSFLIGDLDEGTRVIAQIDMVILLVSLVSIGSVIVICRRRQE